MSHGFGVNPHGLRIFADGRRDNDIIRVRGHLHITLALLAETCDSVPYELMRRNPAQSVNAERERDMLERRHMTAPEKVSD